MTSQNEVVYQALTEILGAEEEASMLMRASFLNFDSVNQLKLVSAERKVLDPFIKSIFNNKDLLTETIADRIIQHGKILLEESLKSDSWKKKMLDHLNSYALTAALFIAKSEAEDATQKVAFDLFLYGSVKSTVLDFMSLSLDTLQVDEDEIFHLTKAEMTILILSVIEALRYSSKMEAVRKKGSLDDHLNFANIEMALAMAALNGLKDRLGGKSQG